jgi:hypothetical protein
MADEQKPQQKWYSTAPGYLTATAALVGSITAAVTGLSQLGVFHSKPDTPAPAVAAASAPAPTAAQRAARRSAPENRAPARVEPAPRTPSRAAPSSAPEAAPAPAPAISHPVVTAPPAAAPAPAPAPPPAPVAKTGSIGPGTTLELASGSRVCSNGSADGDKFTTTTVSPVSGSNGISLPVGTQVILSVVTAKAPVFITAKGVSMDVAGKTVPISGTATAQTQFNAAPSAKGIGIGACIPQGGRVSLRLTDGVSVTQP